MAPRSFSPGVWQSQLLNKLTPVLRIDVVRAGIYSKDHKQTIYISLIDVDTETIFPGSNPDRR